LLARGGQAGDAPQAAAAAEQAVRGAALDAGGAADEAHHGQRAERKPALAHQADDVPVLGGQRFDAGLGGESFGELGRPAVGVGQESANVEQGGRQGDLRRSGRAGLGEHGEGCFLIRA
jgi:hypothetical protein